MRRVIGVPGFRYATLLAVVGVLVGGSLYAAIEEGVGWFDGIWWATSTITTVGTATSTRATTPGASPASG